MWVSMSCTRSCAHQRQAETLGVPSKGEDPSYPQSDPMCSMSMGKKCALRVSGSFERTDGDGATAGLRQHRRSKDEVYCSLVTIAS